MIGSSSLRLPKPPQRKSDKRTVGVQSVFRENETQTDPWSPKFRVVNGKPEVLSLGFMKIERDLPAWRRTVDAIEFMRKRRAWERYLANIYNPENAEYCTKVIADLETYESKLIEQDFDKRNHKRLELAKKEARYFDYTMDQRFIEREQFVAAQIAKKREDKLWAIKAKKTRELRKIDMKQRGVNMKYRHLTPIEEMCDSLSPFHVSVARFGKNPRYATQILEPDCAIVNQHGFQVLGDVLASRANIQKPPGKKVHTTKHNCSAMKEVDPDGNNAIHLEQSSFCIADKVSRRIEGEVVEDEDDQVPLFPSPRQEKDYQAVLLLQTLIRGRAVQNLMYKGRKRNQVTIEEFQSTLAFFQEEEDQVDLHRRRALQRLRYYHLNMKLIGLVALLRDEILGLGIAELALKSQNEVERVTEEKRGYLMALLAERTRWHREAAEAGRRQRELRRRELYDEFFKHVTRRNEITTEFYIKLIQQKVIRDVAEKEADMSARQKADAVEKQDIENAKKKKHGVQTRREAMARLLHDFYMPQISKNLERYSMDYYIDKARKTAINVITDRAKTYGTRWEETTLLEPVNRGKGVLYETCTPLSASQDTLQSDSAISASKFARDNDDTDSEGDLAEKIAFIETFMKQETMSVMDDAEKLGQEAEYYKNKIISRLRAQEEERRKTVLVEQTKSKASLDHEACYESFYRYDPEGKGRELMDEEETKPVTPLDEEVVGEESFEEKTGDFQDLSSSFADYMDRRLLVDSDATSTTTSESEEEGVLKYFGDMPDRFIDELLTQAQVLEQTGQQKANMGMLSSVTTNDPEIHSIDSIECSDVIADSRSRRDEFIKPESEFEYEGMGYNSEQLFSEQYKDANWMNECTKAHSDWALTRSFTNSEEEFLVENNEKDENDETTSHFSHNTSSDEYADEEVDDI